MNAPDQIDHAGIVPEIRCAGKSAGKINEFQILGLEIIDGNIRSHGDFPGRDDCFPRNARKFHGKTESAPDVGGCESFDFLETVSKKNGNFLFHICFPFSEASFSGSTSSGNTDNNSVFHNIIPSLR